MSLSDPAGGARLPGEVASLIGVRRHEREASFAAEQGHGIASCASVQNGNPLFWDDAVAGELTDGPILPPTTLSLWSRPHSWDPVHGPGPAPLPTHFDLKERFGLPDAVISGAALIFAEPVRPGDVMTTGETLRSVSAEKLTALGPGRFWVIEVDYANQRGDVVGVETLTGFGYRSPGGPAPREPLPPIEPLAPVAIPSGGEAPASGPRSRSDRRLTLEDVAVGDRLPDLVHQVTRSTVVLGAVAARDWRPMHHDPAFALERSGVADIFLDTPTQQAWLERLVTDWTGPTGRLGRIELRMGRPVVAGETMALSAEVTGSTVDRTGCGWLTLRAAVSVGGEIRSRAAVTVAVPVDSADNPWPRRGADWMP